MLVLKLGAENYVDIGDRIRVKVLRFNRNSVSIGFDAPADMPILRDRAVNREARIERLIDTGDECK